MIEKILELLKDCWALFTPVVVVFPWESAGILRAGKYHRTCPSGWHWKYPVWEDYIKVDTCITTMRLPPQSLTTKDDTSVVISSVIKYQIRNVKAYVCDILDQKDVLADTTMGAIASLIKTKTYTQLKNTNNGKFIIDAVRQEVNRYGFRVLKITFTDEAKAKSLRLIQAAEKDLDN